MWTCRKCSAEVEDNFEICWSCGTSVDGAQDPGFRRFERDEDVPAPAVTVAVQATTATDKLVPIATFWVAGQAHEVQCILEADGIPVTVAYEFGVATDWFLDNATGSIQLQVAEKDGAKARKVLADHPKEATPLPPAPPKPPEPDEATKFKDQPWLAPIPKDLSREETLKHLEAQVSALIDSKDVPDWKVNPAFHPDIMAFIQKHANNVGFVQKAQALQRNRAKYFATMRAQALAPKPPEAKEEPKEPTPVRPPLSQRLGKALKYGLITLPLKLLLRLLKWTVILGIAAVVLAVVASFIYRGYGQKQLDDAKREVSKIDEAWEWEYLQATRKEVADKDNGALVVLAVAKQLPTDWPGKESRLSEIGQLPPNVALREDQAEFLRGELAKFREPLKDLTKLSERSTGRYPGPSDLARGSHFEDKVPGSLKTILWFDSILHAHDGNLDDALTAARTVLLVGRTVGDEPDMIAQLIRMACRRTTCTSLERILAQNREPNGDALLEVQKLLGAEERENLLVQGLRGARVFADEMLQQVEAGDMAIDSFEGEPSAADRLNNWLLAGRIKECRARSLKMMTEAIALAGEPLESQVGKFAAFRQSVAELRGSGRFGLAYLLVTTPLISVDFSHQTQTQLRCTIAGLAAERYRLTTGRWPDSLDQLVPNYLAALPIDPFAGQPLRLRPTDDGCSIVSIGSNGKEFAFRLWNVDRRAVTPNR